VLKYIITSPYDHLSIETKYLWSVKASQWSPRSNFDKNLVNVYKYIKPCSEPNFSDS